MRLVFIILGFVPRLALWLFSIGIVLLTSIISPTEWEDRRDNVFYFPFSWVLGGKYDVR